MLQLRERLLPAGERLASRDALLRAVSHHEGDPEEPDDRDREVVADPRSRPLRQRGERRNGKNAVRDELHHRAVQDGRDRSRDDGAGPLEEEPRRSDHDQEEESEDGVGPSGGVDEQRDDGEVAEDLDPRGGPGRKPVADGPVEGGQHQGRPEDPVEERDFDAARPRLDEDGRDEDQEQDDDPRDRQPSERPPKRIRGTRRRKCGDPRPADGVRTDYPILLISVNIGRYIAITIPPMITPRMKIMTGSISLTSPWTATSTSSS